MRRLGLNLTLLMIASLVNLSACASEPLPQWFDPEKAHHAVNEEGEIYFRNLYLKDKDKDFFDFLSMRFFGDEEWADHQSLAATVATQNVDLAQITHPSKAPLITWLGHSTFLIQYQGKAILTDPIFSDRASPYSFAGPKRYTPHVIDYHKLPPIDMVIISHNHYDHLDEKAIQVLGETPQYYVPLGLAPWFVAQGVAAQKVTELDWYQSRHLDKVTISALPSQHWSARGLGDRFSTLWASWHIEFTDKTIWFGGDTGYNERLFKEVGEHIGSVDVAIIPIGAYAPRWFMQDYHVNPEEAVRIHQSLNASLSIGMHWGTFPLTAEPPAEPPKRLATALEKAQVSHNQFITMTIGESRVIMDKQE